MSLNLLYNMTNLFETACVYLILFKYLHELLELFFNIRGNFISDLKVTDILFLENNKTHARSREPPSAVTYGNS